MFELVSELVGRVMSGLAGRLVCDLADRLVSELGLEFAGRAMSGLVFRSARVKSRRTWIREVGFVAAWEGIRKLLMRGETQLRESLVILSRSDNMKGSLGSMVRRLDGLADME